jgi:hypothetical protein
MVDWLRAWWRQIVGPPPGDPWEDDPSIVHERSEQHRRGVTDVHTARQLEHDFWRRQAERERGYGAR